MGNSLNTSYVKLWDLEQGVDHLNHGSYGACPISVLEAQKGFQRELERNPVGFYAFWYWDEVNRQADLLAKFLGSKPENLAFVENATSGVNAILRSVIQSNLQPGDQLLTTSYCYGAVRKTLDYVASQTGAEVIDANLSFPLKSSEDFLESFENGFSDKTKYLIIDHVASATGIIFPVDQILSLAKKRGVPVLVDGAHAPALLGLNLEDLGTKGAGWYVGNCHKWMCGPKGSAFIWAPPENQEGLHPVTISHGYEQGFREEFHWLGTRNPSAWLSMESTLSFLKQVGLREMQRMNNTLCREVSDYLCELWEQERTAPASVLGPMETIPLAGNWCGTQEGAVAFMKYLYVEHRVIAQIYPFQDTFWFRVSTQLYNSFSQFERLGGILSRDGLNKISKILH